MTEQLDRGASTEFEEVVTDEGLQVAAEKYHSARVESRGHLASVEVTEVKPKKGHDELFVQVTHDDRRDWLHLGSNAPRKRMDLVEPFDLDSSEGLAELVGSTQRLFLDYSEDVVRESEGGDPIGRIIEFRPTAAGDIDEFDRLLTVERDLFEGQPPRRELKIDATGDGERVLVEASVGGERFKWEFEVPSADEFENSELRRFIEALDAGDPSGLDGHRATVSLADILPKNEMRFNCESGVMAIIPMSELNGQQADDGGRQESNEATRKLKLLACAVLLLIGLAATAPALALRNEIALMVGFVLSMSGVLWAAKLL